MPKTKTWVFQSEDGIDGFISMMGNEIGAIFVRPEKHRHGIGKTLIDFVRQIYSELEVEVFKENKIGRSFYDKYGFRITKEAVHEETGYPILRMKYE